MAKASDSLVADLTRHLAATLPAVLGEVLLPTLRWRGGGARLVAVLPNQVWLDVFQTHVAEPAGAFLRERRVELSAISKQDAEVETRAGAKRFASFLKDPGNQVALTASRRVVEAPGLEHNPLYLHGPPGSGKSHLLAAIAGEFRHMLGDQAVVEFDGPGFVARDALRLSERGSNPLRLAISHAAVIVFDQVDVLAGRALAQEELFHLINSALERGQQLVFAGTHAPRKLSGIEERLATRLSWGLAAAMEPPQAETRLALLRQLAGPAADALEAADLARLVDTLAPDMHQVVRLAERIAEGERVATGSDMASFDRILQVVAERYGLRPGDIAGKRRLREVAQARQMALLLGRRLTAHSLVALGGMVGGRDHSTVLYSIRQAEERLVKEPEMAREVAEITQRILGAGE